jgi:hypothetical protein
MKTIWGLILVIGLCLVIPAADALGRGFGGFRGGFGRFGGTDIREREAFRTGAFYGARRGFVAGGATAVGAAGYYAGGWGMDEAAAAGASDYSDDDDD